MLTLSPDGSCYVLQDGATTRNLDRVTDICDWAGDKFGLIKWYGDNGNEYCVNYSDNAKKIGTATHILIDGEYLPDELFSFRHAAEQRRSHYLKFLTDSQWKPTLSEQQVYSLTWEVAGTLDTFGTFGNKEFIQKYGFTDDKPWILDYKTGRLKQNAACQVVAYGIMKQEMEATDKELFEQAFWVKSTPPSIINNYHYAILQLEETGYTFRPIDDDEARVAAQLFVHRLWDFSLSAELKPYLRPGKTGLIKVKGM